MRFPYVVLVFVCTLMLALPLVAQSPNAVINGLVVDPSNGVIVGADVVVVNDVTGVEYTAKTNAEGIYILPNLPPGSYRLQVSKVGFKTLIKPDITLNVQDALAINFTLPIGATSETVTVEGGAPLINTQDASVSTVVDRQFAENLPMNGRSFQSLIELTPGVVVTPSSAYDAGQFSVNGQRAASNYWMVDGVSANVGVGAGQVPGNGVGGTLGSFSALGGTNSLVSVDAMQEFRIQTSTYAPEFGRTPGGQISIVTRSGANQFHGALFDYLRNDVLDASDWFNGYTNSPPLPKAKERQNDFGGTLSGPLLKDKTFFFFSYEGLRLRLPETTLSNVPDLVARKNAEPDMQPYLNSFPQPNGSDNPATGIAQFNASYSDPATLSAYSLRLDHRLSTKWTLFGRYSFSPSEFDDRGGSSGYVALSGVQPFQVNTQTSTVGSTWSMSPVVTNDLRFNYSRTNAQSYFYQDGFGGAVPISSLPFPNSITSQNGFFNLYIFSLGVGEILNVGRFAQNVQRQINTVDNLSLQKGTHSLKFGCDYRRLSPVSDPDIYQLGAGFPSVSAAEAGSISYASIISRKNVSLLFHNLGAFAQDTWHVLPRLTLTYGLRWDLDFAPSSLDGPGLAAVTGYNLANLSQVRIAPSGTPPFKTTYGNVAPRLGMSYQVSQNKDRQTVLRGGLGIFYDLVSSEAGNVLGIGAPPFTASDYFYSGTFPFTATQIAPLPIPPTGTLSRFEVFNPELKLPYTLEWNVALEQSLGREQTLSASYLGAVGRRLLQTTSFSDPPANPGIGTADFIDNTSRSNYNALQLQFRRRLSHGLQTVASYTWSRSMDDASAGSYGNASNAGIPGASDQNWGPSDFDIRNAFTAGVTYDFPGPHDRAFAGALLRGWSTENFIVARSAPPVDLSDSNFFGFDSSVQANIRPDVVAGEPFYLRGAGYPGGDALNPAAFTNPPVDPITGNPIRQGDLGRNVLRGFGAFQWDLALHRDFPIHESLTLQFRAEMFNVLNHPNFGPPDNQFGTAGFGVSRETLAQSLSSGSLGAGGFNPLYQIGGPRSIQLALKLRF
jgi:hypothetical protein